MKKTFKIVVLPTVKAQEKGDLVFKDQKLYLSETNMNSKHSDRIIGNLYIVSDDKIQKYDYFIRHKKVEKCYKVVNEHEIAFDYTAPTYQQDDHIFCKKIIASTDKSLGYKLEKGFASLPLIPKSFVLDYIQAYNEGKPISEISLEVEYIEEPKKTDDIHLNAVLFDQWLDVKDTLFPKTENNYVIIISIREKAINWWNNLSDDKVDLINQQTHLTNEYYPNRKLNSLTGREIQNIYEKEVN